MSFLRLSFVCLAVAAASAPAFAQDVSPASTTATDAKPVKVRKLCRRETDTGSIMPHTTCHTREEWQAIDGQNQQQIDQMAMHRGAANSGITR